GSLCTLEVDPDEGADGCLSLADGSRPGSRRQVPHPVLPWQGYCAVKRSGAQRVSSTRPDWWTNPGQIAAPREPGGGVATSIWKRSKAARETDTWRAGHNCFGDRTRVSRGVRSRGGRPCPPLR